MFHALSNAIVNLLFLFLGDKFIGEIKTYNTVCFMHFSNAVVKQTAVLFMPLLCSKAAANQRETCKRGMTTPSENWHKEIEENVNRLKGLTRPSLHCAGRPRTT